MSKGKVLAVTLPPELEARLDAYVKAEEERLGEKRIRQACAIKIIEMGLDAAGVYTHTSRKPQKCLRLPSLLEVTQTVYLP